MVRTQMQLTRAQFAALKSRAAAEGRSMADLVRDSLEEALHVAAPTSRGERRRRALAMAGRLRKGASDLSRRHDEYLARTYR